jgi:ATP-dependent DNA helicase RecG
MQITLFKKEVKHSDTLNITENVTESRQQHILSIIAENNHITTEEIARLVGVVRRTIARDIHSLKAKGVLKRIGSDKTGHWQIIKKIA